MMSCVMGDMVRDRLPTLWRRIEDAHYSYLEIDDSPEKLQQKKKLEEYILEYLTLVPHECKFGLAETGKVFQRTISECSDFSAYRAGIGWAAIARYAANLLAQPWRKEYQVIRLYSGFYKHEVEANLCGTDSVLQALGYRSAGVGRLALDGPVCPDMAAAVSRDALIAHCECQMMIQIWEAVWGNGGRVSWAEVARDRSKYTSTAAQAVARLSGVPDEGEIYSNVPASSFESQKRVSDSQYLCNCPETVEEPIQPVLNPYIIPSYQPHVMYPHMNPDIPVPVHNPVPMMTPYGPMPYYYPIHPPYMLPTPVYAPIKQATTVPVNGYPPQYRCPTVPTGQLIELEAPSVYENGRFERNLDERSYRKSRHGESKRNTLKSNSDVSLPSLPRSDTQPSLTKAKEDGMGTYESWDYVFRNLSSKDQEGDSRSGFSQSLDRDSKTLDRLDREERRTKYQPTTLDLEDGLQALNLDRSYDEAVYRTAKVNESLLRLKQEQELKKSRQMAKRIDEKRLKKTESIGHPKADGLVSQKVAQDKVKLLTKRDIKDRKDVIKQQNSVNGSMSNSNDVKKVKKATRLEGEKPKKAHENGVSKPTHVKSTGSTTGPSSQTNYDLKAQLVVTLDEPDCLRRSPPKYQNGERERTSSRTSQHDRPSNDRERQHDRPSNDRERQHDRPSNDRERQHDREIQGVEGERKWECTTCTYLNRGGLVCEMCGKSKRGPEIEPLTSGGRECPACTLVNKREARACDACGTSLEHCPTYI